MGWGVHILDQQYQEQEMLLFPRYLDSLEFNKSHALQSLSTRISWVVCRLTDLDCFTFCHYNFEKNKKVIKESSMPYKHM